MKRAFVLNLDAEHELELGVRWTAPRSLATRLDAIAASMHLPEGAVLLTPGMRVPEGTTATLWCPTPRAVEIAKRAGAVVDTAAPIEVIRTVNERGFAAQLAEGELDATLRATALLEIEAFVARPGPTGRWRLKRGLGASGRGQRSLASGLLSEADRGWIERSLGRGALYVEPEVIIERELAVYGWVRETGRVELTGVRGQTTDARGAFVRCGRIEQADLSAETQPFRERAEAVGAALFAAGYRGPFGTDGFTYRDPSGAVRARTLSEINARFCMGWDERDGFE
jgi:hypothetical protein